MTHAAEYWLRFPDGSPDRWDVRQAGRSWEISFPNDGRISIDTAYPRIEFDGEFAKDRDSSRLWANSLRYLVPILGSGDVDTVWTLVNQLRVHLAKDPRGEDGQFSGSLDHQYALILRTLCELRAWLVANASEVDESKEKEAVLRECVDRIYSHVGTLELLRPNNHGVMLAISMLHSSHMFQEAGSEERQEKVSKFLLDTLNEVLGRDGVANENTPVYQAFYVKLLESIADFQMWAHGSVKPEFAELHDLATKAYRRMLLPNRAVPPLGDASYSQQSAFSPLPGLWCSKENGLLVSSNERTYFSFISGYRGVFHKQLDDSSVFLWHNGDALIQDAGLVSYDSQNDVAVAARGQLGHSGVFFKEYDALRAEKVIAYGPRTRQVSAGIDLRKSNAPFDFQVLGTYAYGRVRVDRTVTWVDPKHFMLRDSVSSKGDAKTPVSRFLLDPSASVEITGKGVVVIRTPRAWMTLTSSLGNVDVEVVRGVRRKPGLPAGFLAPKNYQSTPTTMLEFPIPLNEDQSGKQLFRVTFGSVEDPVQSWAS